MKRFSTLLNRTKSGSKIPTVNIETAPVDSPEATVARSIRDFCESTDNDAEVIHLPVIVDSAESSPVACAAAAQQIRKFLTKEYSKRPQTQTKAVMLIRILSDNPGPNFTRNFDKSFVDTIKQCLRNCNDSTTQQLLRETLDTIEFNKLDDETVKPLVTMWKKEKGATFSYAAVPRPHPGGTWVSGGGRSSRQLPPPEELASRIEESKNTAKILLQLIQTTPSEEVLSNDLLREFGDRCHQAIKSTQNYMNSTNPSPDVDTMQTLIETTEQLSLANSRYQRTVLAARRAAGLASPSPQPEGGSAFAPPANPPPGSEQATTNGHGSAGQSQTFAAPTGPPPNHPSSTGAPTLPPVNPFADPEPETTVPKTTQNFAINTEPTYAGTGSARSDTSRSNEDPYSSSPVRTKPPYDLHSGPEVQELDNHGQVGRTSAATNSRS